MPSIKSAQQLLTPGETALCLFTDGRYLEINGTTGSSGFWRIDPNRAFQRVVIFRWEMRNGERHVDLFTAIPDGLIPITEGEYAGRYTVQLRDIKRVGTTPVSWEDFVGTNDLPVAYVSDAQRQSKNEIDDFYALLVAFSNLPKANRTRTVMDVSGYPHYENVCSNILAFYFDPEEEHGFGDLFVKAFLRMAGHPETFGAAQVNIVRERGTEDGKRLDILVESESFLIGIENKVFHHLGNDLKSYSREIAARGEKQIVVKAVLSLKPIVTKVPLEGGFRNYTYAQFWKEIQASLGHYAGRAHPKWLTYLLDFIENTNNLAGENMQLEKNDQFFITHNETISRMMEERNKFLAKLNTKVSALLELMKEAEPSNRLSKLWIWNKGTLVLDFHFADAYTITFDLVLSPSGWELQLFARNKPSASYLAKLIKQSPLKTRLSKAQSSDDRLIVQKWDLTADLGEIRDSLCCWIGYVGDASKHVV